MLQLYVYMQSLVHDLRTREEGQGIVEYSLILALVVIGAIAILSAIGGNVTTVLTNVKNALGSA